MERIMGKGTVYLMISSFAFVVSNYGVHVVLARYLGPELYGIFGVLISLYLLNKAFLDKGIPRAVSKFIAESKENTCSIIKTSFRLHLFFTLLFALFYIVFAKFIASILRDPSLTKYIMFLSITAIPLSFFSLYVNGYFNGLRLFKKQAIVVIFQSILRAVFTIILVAIGFKIYGALIGYLVAASCALFLAISFLKSFLKSSLNINQKPVVKLFSSRKIINFAIPITIASLAFALIRHVNVLFIKSLLMDNALAGLYTAAATLSTIPNMIFIALPVTLMPSIAKSIAEKNIYLVRKYISRSLRYLILLLFPITALVSATSTELINFLYSPVYAPAGPVLSILIVSSTFLIIFITLGSIITGSGKPKNEMIISLLFVIVISFLNLNLIPLLGILGAAVASLITSLVTLVISGIYVYSKFGVLMRFLSFLRILISAGVIFSIALFWHHSGIVLIFDYIFLSVLYLILLIVLGEIKNEDLVFVRKIIPFYKKK